MMEPEREPVRLWLLSYNFRPVWAGPAERFLRYAPGLRRRGVELTFFSVMRPGQPRDEEIDGTRILRLGPERADVESIHRFDQRVMLRALAARKQGARPHALLFIGISPADLPLLWALRAAGVATMHVSTMARDRSRPRLRQWAVDRALAMLERGFDRVITSSQALRDEHAALGTPLARLPIIPNGVSLARFRPAIGPDEVSGLRARLELPAGEPIALFAGPMVERKGLFELVEAWRLHRARGGPGWLVLVGRDEGEDPLSRTFTARWRALCDGLRPDDHVLRRPPHAAIEEYFRACDLFLFLSRLEGLPNVIPEAMACGLPLVTTRFHGFSPELGRDGQELVISPRDPAAVADRIGALFADGDARRAMGARGRAWVEAHQDVELSLDGYAALCREVAAEKRSLRRRIGFSTR